jgi:hypothetical protein
VLASLPAAAQMDAIGLSKQSPKAGKVKKVTQNYPLFDTGPDHPRPVIEKKHSGFGIASFIINILAIASFVCFSLTLGRSPGNTVFTAVGLASFALLFIGIGLGFAGLFHRNRKKIFAILSLALSFFWILGTIALYILGTAPAS